MTVPECLCRMAVANPFEVTEAKLTVRSIYFATAAALTITRQ